jgi:hypothetical protein
MQHQLSQDMQNCIDECLQCYQTCTREAMNHCLETGGKHVEPNHFRLMMNCAEMCRTAADFMLSGSALHVRVCAVCADVCDACAENCEQIGDMDDCAQACRRCAQTCRQMGSPAGENAPALLGGRAPSPSGTRAKAPM